MLSPRPRSPRKVSLVIISLLLGLSALAPGGAAYGHDDPELATDIAFRESLHFRADLEYVAALRTDSKIKSFGSTPLTPDELSELQARMALEEDAEFVEAALADNPAFAGLFIDHSTGGELAVLLVSGDLPSDIRSGLKHPDRLSVRPARFSLGALTKLHLEIDHAMQRDDPSVMGVKSVSTDVTTNSVQVEFAAEALGDLVEAPERFAQRFPEKDMLRVVAASELPIPGSLACDPNAPPIKGGHGFGPQGPANCPPVPASACTAGFKVWRGNLTPARMLTAGHCLNENVGVDRYHRNVSIGEGDVWAVGGGADLALLKLSASATMQKEVWYGLGTEMSVPLVGTALSYAVGIVRCFTGMSTGVTRCGVISNNSWSGNVAYGGTLGTVFLSNMVVVNAGSRQGDSGAPVFKYDSAAETARANGIVWGVTPTQTWYSKWTNIPTGWAVTLAT